MADYQQLLKRAIDSLTDNNGANRRQIYEKARTALVSQLRAVEPPLSASEITQHRLSLEDCIHEVEQNAIRVLMDGMRPSPVSARDDEDDIAPVKSPAAKPVVEETVEAEEAEPESEPEEEEAEEAEESEAEETDSNDSSSDAAESDKTKPDEAKPDEAKSGGDESGEDEPDQEESSAPDTDEKDSDESEADDDEAEATADTETSDDPDENVEDEPVAQDEANDAGETDETASNGAENDESEESSAEDDGGEPTDTDRSEGDEAEDADDVAVDDEADDSAENSDDDQASDDDEESDADQPDVEEAEEEDGPDADEDEPSDAPEKSDDADTDATADLAEEDDAEDGDDADTEETDDAGDESEETDGVADPSADAAEDVADEVKSTDSEAEEDPQVAIDRAIAKLTRQDVEPTLEIKSDVADVPDVEFSGSETLDSADSATSKSVAVELPEEPNIFDTSVPVGVDQALDDAIDSVAVGVDSVSGSDSFEGTDAPIAPRKSFGALRILFFTIILLLAIFAGAVYWAWDTGRVDLTTVFDRVSAWRTSITQMIAGDDSESDAAPVAEIETPAETDTEVSDPAPNSESDPEVVIENGAETDVPQESVQEAGQETAQETEPETTEETGQEAEPETEPVSNVRVVDEEQSETAPETEGQSESETGNSESETGDVLATETEAETETGNTTGTQKSEDRLPSGDTTAQTNEPAVNADGTVSEVATPDVSQSILLEEQPSGSTGGLPFSGNVVWDRTVDSAGVPAIRARAKIPARNISLDLIIRKNFDTQLPASHVMEINFTVQPTFAGGGVANVPGILMKNEELTQGKALIGASARVLDNSFLVALSQAEADLTHNLGLLAGEEWIDVPMVYSTGKRAIMTLEKGADGAAVFAEVMAEWAKTE